MLKGQAKKDYQREYMRGYMRDRRLKMRDVKTPETIGVKTLEILDKAMAETPRKDRGSFAQYVDADGNPVYE